LPKRSLELLKVLKVPMRHMNFPGARFIAVAGFAMAIGIRTGSAGYGVAALLAGRVTSRTRAWTLAVL
jgi:hypothetical protein